MDVTSVGTASIITGVSTTPAQPTAIDDASLPAASQTSISDEGEIFGQLADLARTDPTKFKKVTAEVAQKLKDEASNATGDKAKFLDKLSDRFNQAAQSGDISALKPQRAEGAGGHGHHHHHSGGGQGGSGTGSLVQIISAALQDVGGTTTAASTASAATEA